VQFKILYDVLDDEVYPFDAYPEPN